MPTSLFPSLRIPVLKTFRPIFLLLVLGLAVGCGGRDRTVEGGEGILLAGTETLMGELEERAAGFLLDMTFVLESNMDDPDEALDRFGVLFSVNGAAMRENAEALGDKFAAMNGQERRTYEAQFAAFMREANEGWRIALSEFHAQHREVGNQIHARVENFDARWDEE